MRKFRVDQRNIQMTETQKILAYFWDRCEENKTTGCWDWTGNIRSKKSWYGVAFLFHKRFIAHRKSYELFVGTIPDGAQVLHKCDNRKCINPKHLYLGTALENMRDRRDRHPCGKGKNNWRCKLSEEQIVYIRSVPGKSRDLAKVFGVCKSTINNVRSQKCYKDVVTS